MANTLTNLIRPFYEALDVVSRELVGFIPAVNRNSTVERAALNQSVRVPIVPAITGADNTPAVTPPDTGDQSIDNVEITISKSRHWPVRWNGEETLGLENSGTYDTITRDRFAQAIRTAVNEIELDLAGLYVDASRAHGTAGTTPFGTANDLSDVAGVWQILADNGAPQSDLHLVISTAAAANIMGKQSQLFKVNEAGTADLLRRGTIGEIEGFSVHKSAQVKSHTKGTGASYLVNDATPPAVGDVSITVDTGTGTIIAGDVITLAGDTNKYVVDTALAANVVTIAKPGLRVAADDDDAITVGNSYRANMAFYRGAIVLATRAPALPRQGDLAIDREILTDPVTGLSFELAAYPGFRQMTYHVSIAWGYKLIKPEHVAILLG
jgi:hypothetical protein